MDLKEYYEKGLSVDAFEDLLSDDQARLHALHGQRATIEDGDIDAIGTSRARFVLVITEPWCGDSLAIFPIVSSLFRQAGCEVRVVQRDLYPELIDRYLTGGGRAIPIVLVLDEHFDQILRWGPRPAPAQRIVSNSRTDVQAERIEKVEVHKQVRTFYSRDRGRTIVKELVEGLSG